MSSLKINSLNMSSILSIVKSQTASGAGGTSQIGYAVLRETQPAGINSTVSFPNTTSNVRTLRQINNIKFDNLGITISGSPNWTITIPTAGTYAFNGRAMFNITKVDDSPYIIAVKSKVFISTDTSANFIVGDSMTWNLSTSSNDTFNVNVDVSEVASITGSTTFTFNQVCNPIFTGSTQVLTGGRAVNILSAPEVYATLQITKLS